MKFKLTNLFKKKEVIPTRFCSCKQEVTIPLYKTKMKAHVIGSVNKYGKTLTLYCNGKEAK